MRQQSEGGDLRSYIHANHTGRARCEYKRKLIQEKVVEFVETSQWRQ